LEVSDIGGLEIDVKQSAEARLQGICKKYGLKYAGYATVDQNRELVQGFTTYPDAWVEYYLSNGLADFDPVLKHGPDAVAPIDWAIFEKSPQYQKLFKAAREFGIGYQGISIPVIGPFGDRGVLSVSSDLDSDGWQQKLREVLPLLRNEAGILHLMTLDALYPAYHFNPEPLSQLEHEILQMTATGFSTAAISHRLQMVPATLDTLVGSIKTKLRSSTIEQAVGRAVAADILRWSELFADPILEITDAKGEHLIGGVIRWSGTVHEVIPFEWRRAIRSKDRLRRTSLDALSELYQLDLSSVRESLELPENSDVFVRNVT